MGSPGVRLGVWAGAVGGLAGVAAMEVIGRLTGVATLPALLQDPLLAAMPGPVFGFLIDTLQHWGKVLEEAGLLAAMVVVLAALGAAAGAVARRRPGVRGGLLAAAAAWLVVVVVLLPAAGAGFLGLTQGVAPLVSWTLVFAVYALVWEWLGGPRPEALAVDPARRRVLAALPLAVAGVSLGLVGLLRVPEWLRSAVTPPESIPAAPVPALTPVSEFYVVSKNFQDPVVSAGGWALQVTGLVGRPLHLNLDELEAIPAVTQVVTLECVSNLVGGALMSTGRFTGVPLRDLVAMAGPRPGAGALLFTARDGYTESLSLDAVTSAPEVVVAYRLGGAPLPDVHGFPARVLVPGHYGMKGPKWLDRIELVASVEDGYWEEQGWDRQAVVQTTARFDVPTGDSPLHVHRPTLLAGVAFAGSRGIQAVEWTANDGRTWHAAELEPPLSPLTWVRWRSSWTPPGEGEHQLMVRARDGTGEWQTATEVPSFPSGATGYHRLDVYVGA